MGAGRPDYMQLMKLGKLPKGAHGNIPYLKELEEANNRIEELEIENKKLAEKIEELRTGGDSGEAKEEIMIQCEVEGCEFVAKGSQGQAENRLRLHGRTHEVKA